MSSSVKSVLLACRSLHCFCSSRCPHGACLCKVVRGLSCWSLSADADKAFGGFKKWHSLTQHNWLAVFGPSQKQPAIPKWRIGFSWARPTPMESAERANAPPGTRCVQCRGARCRRMDGDVEGAHQLPWSDLQRGPRDTREEEMARSRLRTTQSYFCTWVSSGHQNRFFLCSTTSVDIGFYAWHCINNATRRGKLE